MTSPLLEVRRATEGKRRAERRYRTALLRAVEALEAEGRSDAYTAVARVAGVSRQAVRQLVLKHSEPADPEPGMVARLAEIDAKWDALVDGLADAFVPADPVGEQARRNLHNGKAKKIRSGKDSLGRARGSVSAPGAARIFPTVRAEARARAEAACLQLLEDRLGEPWVDRVVAELDEAETLREALTALRDSRVSFLHD